MELIYELHGLDCANCAAKLERRLEKLPGVRDVHIQFAMKKLYIHIEHENVEAFQKEMLACIHEIEPDVVCHEVKKHHHTHEHGTCDCHHAHKEEREIAHALKFHVQNLDCASCAQKVEEAIAKDSNMEDVSLNFSSGVLFVKLKKKEDMEQLEIRLNAIADQAEQGVVISSVAQKQEKASWKMGEIARLIIGLVLFMLGIYNKDTDVAMWIFLTALIISGGPVIWNALRNMSKGQIFDENFLMSIATIGAFGIGEWAEGVAVMIFYEIGELFQSYAVNRSRKSISSLMDIRADYANLIRDNEEIKVSLEEVSPGDRIRIRAGERVPLDGKIIHGTSSLDTSALSGESLPKDVAHGDHILAGSVNLNGVLEVEVEKSMQESTVSRILEMVENAGSKKAPMEKFITKFARVYTPVVVIMAVLLFLIPVVFFENAVMEDWLYRSLTFLVISCPCALVVSIPLGLFAGIGGASRKGILIKGGNYLEALCDVDTVVFDKTGTLTEGKFYVEKTHPISLDSEELLRIGAYGESYSNHPIAKSIVQAYGKDIDKSRIHDFKEISGKGISVKIDEISYCLGNTAFMDEQQIKYEQTKEIGTIVHIAKDRTYLGYIVISDRIKQSSKEAIQALKQLGIKQCIMLSGDRQAVADKVASDLGLDQAYAELLPQDKVEKVESLMKQCDGNLAFVGDGINDAPVLARADIGVAMGGIGSDAAIEAADIVLMKDDPMSLVTALNITKKTKRILWQNIAFSLGIKLIVLGMTVFGFSSMWMGVFADVGVTLLAVLNAMRSLRIS